MADVRIRITGDATGIAAASSTAERSLQRVGQAATTHSASAASGMRTMGASATNAGASISSAMGPARTLLESVGGVSGDVFEAGSAIGELGSSFGLMAAGAGIAALAIGSVALAFYQGHQESKEFAKSLALTGNYAATSAGKFDSMAASISISTNASIGSSRELLMGLVSTGSFGAESIESVAKAMSTLQSISGADSKSIISDFAGMSKGVTAWAVEHNKQYHYLTKAEYDQIKALELANKTEEAMKLNAEKLGKVLADRKQNLGTLEKAWKLLGDAASFAWDKMLDIGRNGDDAELESSKKRLDILKSQSSIALEKQASLNSDDPRLKKWNDIVEQSNAAVATEEANLSRITGIVDARNRKAVADAKTAADEQKKIADAESGKTAALANASIDARLAREADASATRLYVFGIEQQQVDAATTIGLKSAEAASQERIEIMRREAAERQAMFRAQEAAEKSRPALGPVESAAKAGKIQGIRYASFDAARTDARALLDAQASASAAQLEQARADSAEWAQLWQSAADYSKSAAAATASAMASLITDPMERARAEAALAVRDLQEAADKLKQGLQIKIDVTRGRAASAAPDESARLLSEAQMLASQIDGIDAAVADSKVARAKRLEQSLKPSWQSTLESWQDTGRVMKEGWDSTMDGILKSSEDAFVELAMTGKLNTKSLVNSIIAEMLRVQFKMLAGKISGSLFGDLLGSIGSVFGFGKKTTTPSDPMTFGDMGLDGVRAAGGPVSRGGMYLVGERGPELLRMGSQNGSIIPNKSLGGSKITYAPIINIDSRSDRQQISVMVANANADGQRQMVELLRAKGVI